MNLTISSLKSSRNFPRKRNLRTHFQASEQSKGDRTISSQKFEEAALKAELAGDYDSAQRLRIYAAKQEVRETAYGANPPSVQEQLEGSKRIFEGHEN